CLVAKSEALYLEDSRDERVRPIALLVLVVAADPQRLRRALLTTLRRSVQQRVVGDYRLDTAGGCDVGAVDSPFRECVHAYARPLGDVPARVRAAHAGVQLDRD